MRAHEGCELFGPDPIFCQRVCGRDRPEAATLRFASRKLVPCSLLLLVILDKQGPLLSWFQFGEDVEVVAVMAVSGAVVAQLFDDEARRREPARSATGP